MILEFDSSFQESFEDSIVLEGGYPPLAVLAEIPNLVLPVDDPCTGDLISCRAASVLLLVFRVGLSRGVLIVDFLLCATLTVVGRVSFRFLDDVREKWSSEGAPAAFVGRIEDAELAFRALRGLEEPRLRPVAVVDYMYGGRRGRFKGYPLFGGDTGLERAVRECGVNAVVVIERGGVMDGDDTQRVGEYLSREGALDVFAVRISVGLAPRSRRTLVPGAGCPDTTP